MSIIYDAIKKVEERPFLDSTFLERPLRKKKKTGPILILVLICAAGIIGGTFIRLTKIKKTDITATVSLSPASIPPAPVVEPTPPVVEPLPTVVESQALLVEPAVFPQEEAQKSPLSEETFILNGIFFSENEGYALISDKIVKKGDAVNKAIVKRIDVDTVELELEDGSTVSLSTTR